MKLLTKTLHTLLYACTFPVLANAATGTPVVIDSTMNALDHVLQRPAPTERFAGKRFGDRLFISAEAGPDWMRTNAGIIGSNGHGNGYRTGLTIGDWITPVHGWRLGISTGKHHGVNNSKPYFVGLSLDYMMNLSSLLRKDNPSRRFELIGIMGLEGQALHREGHRLWGTAGARIGMQPRLYVTNSTYLYIEPRIGIYTDALDDVKTWHKYDWNASVMVGLGYRMTGGRGLSVDNSLFGNDSFRDNLFVGFSGGVIVPGNNTSNIRQRIGATGSFSIGKWFSAPAALRLSVGGAQFEQPGKTRRYATIADLDYLWNLNSAFVGYDPDSRIESNIVLGASALYRSGSDKKFFPGLHAGFQGIWKVTPSVGLYIEPNLRAFDRKLTGTNSRLSLMPGVNVGMIYRFNRSEKYDNYRSSFDYNEFLSSRRYFFDLAGGLFMRSSKWNPNSIITLGFGKWFTPESAWRINGEYAYMRTNSKYRSISLSADYILSLSTLAAGFDDERFFDIDALIGLTAGAANYNHGHNNLVWGPRAGLRGRFNVSPALDIILEPQVQMLSIPGYNRRYNPETRLLAGISYKIGRSKGSKSSSSSLPDYGFRPFVSLSGCPLLYSESIFHPSLHKVSWGLGVSAGSWITNTSGFQLSFAYDRVPLNRKKDQSLKTITLDYMLNLTRFFSGETDRRFEISPMLGAGIGWGRSKASPAVEGGIRASYHISPQLDLTLNPMVTVWGKRINGNAPNNHHFVGVGRLPFGLSYRF